MANSEELGFQVVCVYVHMYELLILSIKLVAQQYSG